MKENYAQHEILTPVSSIECGTTNISLWKFDRENNFTASKICTRKE
jgi:hypothetical protein